MTKNFLLAATAVGALALAGAASAHDLSFRATGPAGAITSADVNADGVFAVAKEVALTDLGSGVLALSDVLDSGSLPSGNALYKISLTNATFGTPVSTPILTPAAGGSCTAVVSSGGAANTSDIIFLVSSTGSCTGFDINLPIKPTTVGTVSVKTTYTTENENPIDGGTETLAAISLVDAFQPTFNGSLTGAGAQADTLALLPDYTTLGGDNVLGKLAIYVDLTAHYSLDPADTVSLTDVTDASVTVTGNFSAFDDGTLPTLEGNTADDVSGTEVSFDAAEGYIVEDLASKPNGSAFEVYEDGDVIQASSYVASIDYDLDTQYAAQTVASSNSAGISPTGPDVYGSAFERIEREGTNVLLPWMNSAATAAVTGTNNTVRISNTGTEDAAVSVDVLSSSDPAYNVAAGVVSIGTVPAGGELVLTAASLAVLGDFRRGDVQVIVESDPELITVKRYAILANGSVTEFESGSVASDQNVQSVP